MIKEPGAEVAVAPDVGVSQYFRREILSGLGEADDWDYWLFPRPENLCATFQLFGRET